MGRKGNDDVNLINVEASTQVAVDAGAGNDSVVFKGVTGPKVANREITGGADHFVKYNSKNQGVKPVDRTDGTWPQDQAAISADVESSNPENLFIGDSITWLWTRKGRAAWDQYFVPIDSANLGLFGDRTQNVLWRIDNGNLAHSNPKVAVVLIGTNNLSGNNLYVADGIEAVVDKLRVYLPNTKILLLSLLPRGAAADGPFRPQIAAVNNLISQWQSTQGDTNVSYLDIDGLFVDPAGAQKNGLFVDQLHPTAQGYDVLAQAILPSINNLRSQQLSVMQYLLYETTTSKRK